MGRVTVSQQNLSGGELSPSLNGRFDLNAYYNGGSWYQNFIATVQGMAKYRSGTRHVWHTRNNGAAILIPFEFNTEQAYVLEFSDLKMRIIKDGGLVTDTPLVITGITNANPAVVTYTGADPTNGQRVVISDVVGMTQVNNLEFEVANVNGGANTFELSGINSLGYTAYTSGGEAAVIIEVTSPYAASELFDLDYAQTKDTMYIVHPSHAPYKLTRSSHTAWTLGTYARTADPFGSAGNYPSVVSFFEQRLLMFSTDNDPHKFWGSVGGSYDDFTTGIDADDAFVYSIASGKVNRIRWAIGTEDFLAIGTAGGEFKASGGGSDDPITPTNITVKPPSFYGSLDVKPIRLDSHILYLQRDGNTLRSFEFDAIQDGFTSINRNLTADHILKGRFGKDDGGKQMAHQAGNPAINWVIKNDGILAGMTFEPREQVNGWHRHIAGGSLASGKNLRPEYESVCVIPQDLSPDQTFFIVKRTVNGSTVRYIEYFSDQPNIPKVNDYFTGVDNKDDDTAAFLQDMWEAQKRLFYVDSGIVFDGTVAQTGALSLATVGEGRTFTAGAATFAGTAADVGREIWGKLGGQAVITAAVSTTVCTVEIVEAFPDTAIASGNWYFTSDTFTGLQHLEGETIVALVDGAVVRDLTVVNGTIELDAQASYVVAGYQYLGLYQSMDIEAGGDNGPGVTKRKNINNIAVRFLETLGAKVGTSLYKMSPVKFRTTDQITGRPPPLSSAVHNVPVKDSWTDEKYIYCVQDSPLPCNLQIINPYLTTNDG